jgi:hypothetical protein
MERLQNAPESSRSPAETAAIRTQMEDIHRRLTDLMQRVQAAKAALVASSSGGQSASSLAGLQAGLGADNGGPSTKADPDQARLDQLKESMSQLQSLLQQMQSGAPPGGQ